MVGRGPGAEEHAPRRGEGLRAGVLLALALLILALAQTWPLALHLTEGIPYGYRVPPGYEIAPLIPGDHMQFLYWCWLQVDNLFGPSALFSNPYEFNTSLSAGIAGFANFPFSLLYVAFYPLGQIGAYNALVLLSYLLAGLSAYFLAAEVLEDRLAAVPAGIVFALLPFRAAQVLSGHLFGFTAFLLPLTLLCLERGFKRGSWRWGLGAGCCLAAAAFMEQHLIYYSALFLGLYVPLRMLLDRPASAPLAGSPRDALMAAAGGAGLGLALGLFASQAAGKGSPWDAVLSAGLYAFFALPAWLLASYLIAACTSLDAARARRLAARGMAPLALAALYILHPALPIPYLGTGLIALALSAGAALTLPALWRARRRPEIPGRLMAPLIPLVLGLGLAVARQLQAKAAHYDASIASQGRSLREVLLFSPHPGDLLNAANAHMERLLYFGLVTAGLALLGFILLALARPRGARQGALAALWGFLAVLTGLLALGPTVDAAPLYALLYDHLPFFNYPRVPGRIIIFAVLMLSLLGGWALREAARGLRKRKGATTALALILTAALAWDVWPQTPTGICMLPPPGKVDAAIRRNMATGPRAGERLLGLPIWPGDSHQSSIYDLTITRTRALMINGYSPVVHRDYIEQVYAPLYPLDLGATDAAALAALAAQKVKLIAFHDDDKVYSRKVSPFPPALARQRLLASGAFELLTQERNVFLARVRPDAKPDPDPGRVTSPVTSLWEAEWLLRSTGRLHDDPRASGWGQMFIEPAEPMAPLGPRRARARGNVVSARAGRDKPGFLCFGPYKNFPAGRYRAVFRLRRGPGPVPGWIEVSADRGERSLVRAELSPALLPADGKWRDAALEFELKKTAELELRVFFAGRSDLDLDVVLVSFAGAQPPGLFYRAQDLWRQTGDLIADPRVPGGLAVLLRAGYHPPLYAMHGPQKTLAPGRYRALFRLALEGSAPTGAAVADLVAAADQGQRPLGYHKLLAGELSRDYRDVAVEFTVKRRCEIGLRVRFRGRGSLRVAGGSFQKID